MLYHTLAASCSTTPLLQWSPQRDGNFRQWLVFRGHLLLSGNYQYPIPTNAASTCSTVLTLAPFDSRWCRGFTSGYKITISFDNRLGGQINALKLETKPEQPAWGRSAITPVCGPVPDILTGPWLYICLSGLKPGENVSHIGLIFLPDVIIGQRYGLQVNRLTGFRAGCR